MKQRLARLRLLAAFKLALDCHPDEIRFRLALSPDIIHPGERHALSKPQFHRRSIANPLGAGEGGAETFARLRPFAL
jgi:hypothetical protein